ncbi:MULTISPECIES: GNAT family N-acetyltransferase [Salegentibacter]|uniref:GNAT family N-acetyltransferase n=1 Tax=Salegentibacter TaxID=143222 RepID=UPI00187B8FFC|nr:MULTISPECIES: GNAT family N-acetyltransferase [Salegentibacter]MBE7641285.1 GNAT family N-acetyltransferase [Salegentibacter sp. BLCTC]MBI6117413.1 N-acetyltransferase [Salegentibacter maritimus]
MKIEQIDEVTKGFFKAVESGKQAGKIEYTWAGKNKFIVDHTEVNPEFKGKGVGKKLVQATVNFAKENKLKVIPLCPFAKSVIEKTSEFQEILA